MTELTVEQLKDENEVLRKTIDKHDYFCEKILLAMQAACIEAEHGEGHEAGMQWIFNTLSGPGNFASDEERDAQAYFNRENEKIDKELDAVMGWFSERWKREQGIKP
ncbi:hypothetical protein [Pectobacterium odoriferum]|uniref:hypothetical protein n=1 Tax=Pectobacterium odoriferum TaxID=78398 RepID=UPI00068F4FD7|nr:hypothetical protein [Pectobacterium odoriferum]